MKKFYLLLATACAVASASAVEKEVSASRNSLSVQSSKLQSPVLRTDAHRAALNLRKAMPTRADEAETTFFRAAEQVMSMSFTSKGYGLNGNFGFASSYGEVIFKNFSTGVSANEWMYANVNDYDGNNWVVNTTDELDLAVKSSVGEMMPPILNTKYVSGAEGNYETDKEAYLCGGGAEYWFGQGNDEVGDPGVTFYQNIGLKNPEGYTGDVNALNAYLPGQQGWNENGVYSYAGNPNNWESVFSEDLGTKVSDLMMQAYYLMQPKPTSTYFFTTSWIWVSLVATADTQLISYVYPIDEEGVIAEMPIALGYAAVPKGNTDMLQFYYNPLNEDGDEIEGEVFVDSAVAITIEGFNGNSAIKQLCPVHGFYPFDINAYLAGRRDLFRYPTIWIDFSMKANGETVSIMDFDGSGYYFDQREEKPGVSVDRNTIAPSCYAILCMDAVYPYIHSVEGIESVKVPLTGGEEEIDVYALYYDINAGLKEGWYTLTAPEWLTVKFGESDGKTGVTPMTVTAAPSDVDRTGVVTVEGLGVSYSLKVIQGEGDAVNVVVADKNAEYFDLTGRRVANPEKGIYIKKSGKKAEKVLF